MNFQSIALPPAHASFFELDLREYSPAKASNDATVTLLRGDLAEQRLLLVHDETLFTAREWARCLARDLGAETDLPVLEWQGFADEAPDALDLHALFAADGGIDAMTAPAIFIIPDVKQTALADWLFSLQPVLEGRNQYALLCTALPQSCWPLTPNEADTFWRAPRTMETTASGCSCASQSSAPVNVAGLYQHLDRSEQLCLVGLCLCGELRDDHFFAALDRIIDDAWPALRSSVGTLDYADLARLEPLLRYVEVQPGYTKIEHRSGAQRRQLLALIRRSRWHHLRVALPVLGSLLEEWLAADGDRNAEYAYSAQATTHALRDLAHQSTGLVADLLWRLATSEAPAVRTVAARVLAGDDPHDAAQRDLYRLLETWVSQRLSDGMDGETDAARAWDSPAQRARQTAIHAVGLAVAASARCPDSPELPAELERVRNLLQEEDETEEPLESDAAEAESALPLVSEPPSTPLHQPWDEILEMARDPELHNYVVELVSNPGTDAEELKDVLRNWQERAVIEREGDWLPVAFVAARTNRIRTLGADDLYSWLGAEVTDTSPEAYETVAMLLPHNRYAYDFVLSNRLSQLSDLLLHLAQKSSLRRDLVDLCTTVHGDNPPAVQEMLETWYAHWQHRDENGSPWGQIDWEEVQRTAREICQRVDCQGWHIWATQSADPVPMVDEFEPVEETPVLVEDKSAGAQEPRVGVDSEPVVEEPPADEADEFDELETELADLTGMVRYAARGDAERGQVIDRFIDAYRGDSSATQNRLNDLQIEALQKLNEDANSSVEGLGLIGIIRDRIEEIEHDA